MKSHIGQGDSGETHTIGGSKIPKDSFRIEAIGTLDELNCALGSAIAFVKEGVVKDDLQQLQQKIIVLSGDLATPALVKPALKENVLLWLKELIEKYEMLAKGEIKGFILPGETKLGSFIHQARAIARRAERRVLSLSRREDIHDISLKFLNRLSDVLFQIAVFVDTI